MKAEGERRGAEEDLCEGRRGRETERDMGENRRTVGGTDTGVGEMPDDQS